MFNFVRMRFEASRLGRALGKSLVDDPDSWKIEGAKGDHATISDGTFKISVSARRLRILDSIHVSCDGAEVWLPLVARLRLRNAVRLFLARDGNDCLAGASRHRRRRTAPAAKAG
jgi:hypothetical protein